MASFATFKQKLDKKVEKALEEKQPVIVQRKPGEERINTNLKALTNQGMVIDLERFNKYKTIAKEFDKLSGSILDTVMLLSSWVSHNKINMLEKDAILDYINNR